MVNGMTRRSKASEGFTLVELMIVMIIIGVLLMIAVPKYERSVQLAREAVLKEDLQTMRKAIDSYTVDKQKGPQGLDDVVRVHYLITDASYFNLAAPVFGQYLGKARPAATALVVGLVDARMKIEIEVTARLPSDPI